MILHLYARSHRERLEDAIAASLSKVMGAFSLLFLTPEALVAARDPWGFRPLVIGKLEGASIISSETCALDLIDAEYVRDVEPGELVVVDRSGLRSFKPFPPEPVRQCVFEHVYFARPDSLVFGRNVLASRLLLGRQLAREAPADADIVVPIPDSGMGAALGYAQESGLPFQWGLIRNHYVGRTFIEPKQSIRSFGVKIKLNPVAPTSSTGKRVVLIDDSIVRGTTSRKIVGWCAPAGAREVHLRISSPPTTGPCYYGIDTPLKSELIASNHSLEEIRQYIEADSLAYLSHEGLLRAVGDAAGERHCTACFSGRYPVAVTAARRLAAQAAVRRTPVPQARERSSPCRVSWPSATSPGTSVAGGDVLGGTVSYAAMAAQRLGWEAGDPHVRPARTSTPRATCPGIDGLRAPRAAATTRFVNLYDDARRSARRSSSSRADDIDLAVLPDAWRNPDVLLLGPGGGRGRRAASRPPSRPRSSAPRPRAGCAPSTRTAPSRRATWPSAARRPRRRPRAVPLRERPARGARRGRGVAARPRSRSSRSPGAGEGSRSSRATASTTCRAARARKWTPTGAGDVFAAAFLVRYHEMPGRSRSRRLRRLRGLLCRGGRGRRRASATAPRSLKRLALRERLIEEGEWDE